MKLKIMEKGDTFIGLFENKIALKRENGEIRIVVVEEDEMGIKVDKKKELIIGFGNGAVEVGDMETGIEVTRF